MPLDLNRLTEEERRKFYELADKADPPQDPPKNDPAPQGNGEKQPTPDEVARSATSDPADGLRDFGEYPLPNQPTISRLPDPATWAKKMIDGVSAVGATNYALGIRSPRKDPIAAGIAAQGAYENKMRDPAVLKRRSESLAKTNMAEWAAMAETVGAQSYVQGVVGRRPKIERRIAKLQPLLANALARIDAMPSTTDAERENKAVAMIRALRALKGQSK